jgi:hypothetical protein
VTILEAELFYPTTEEQRQRAYAVHHKARSWKDPATLRIDLERAEREVATQKELAAKRKLRYQQAETELDRLRRAWPYRVRRLARRALRRDPTP